MKSARINQDTAYLEPEDLGEDEEGPIEYFDTREEYDEYMDHEPSPYDGTYSEM